MDFAHAQGSTNCKGAWEEKDQKLERKPLGLHNIQIGGITWNDNNLSSRKVEHIAQIVFG